MLKNLFEKKKPIEISCMIEGCKFVIRNPSLAFQHSAYHLLLDLKKQEIKDQLTSLAKLPPAQKEIFSYIG